MSKLSERIDRLSEKQKAVFELLLKKKQSESAARKQITRQPRDTNTFPLSFAQQRLWFMNQLQPDLWLYNIWSSFRLSGSLNIGALERSLNEVIRRHEVLRTTIDLVNDEPAQIIAPPAHVALPVVDLSHLPGDERDRESARLAAREYRRPFDLARGPLLRTTLLRLGEEDHVVLCTTHHIISDDWSSGVLIREMSILYGAFSSGSRSPLEELPIQYVDYAAWQQQWLRGPVLEEQLNYWREQLGGALPALELPSDRLPPRRPSFQGAGLSFELPADLSESVLALSKREDATLFMVLLAAFQTLLYRYTGQEDILVGSPIAGRTRVETEGLIGFFINVLAMRCDLSGSPSFRELLGRVREMTLGAFNHQDLPFESLVDELQPERSLSRSPIFQVAFVFQNAPKEGTAAVPELSIEPVGINRGTSKFDLTLSMMQTEAGLGGAMEYSTDLFDRPTMLRLQEHLTRLLQSIVADVDAPISTLEILTDAERRQLLEEWNATATDYPADKCIHELIERQALESPEAVAVAFDEKQLTYSALNERANQLAHHLRKLGVGREVRVGICVERSLEMIVGLLGILKAGGVYVPLDPAYPVDRLAFIIEDAQISVLLTESLIVDRLPSIWAHIICLDDDWDSIARESRESPARTALPENLAYAIYTSGSTGEPKGVMINHSSLVNHALALSRAHRLAPVDRHLQLISFGFDASAEEIFPTLISGAALVLHRNPTRLSGPDLMSLCRQQSISVLHSPAVLWQQTIEDIAGEKGSVAESLRSVLTGGEGFRLDKLREFAHSAEQPVQVLNAYGPTEATITTTFYETYGHHQPDTRDSYVPVGKPIANAEVYLLDGQMQLVPVGVEGELFIAGAGVGRGYLNRPDLTAERFIPNAYSNRAGDRVYRTGDVVRYLPSGDIEFIGRTDQQVKLRGYRIELSEIEALLSREAGVSEAVVIVKQSQAQSKQLVGYVAGEASWDELKRSLSEKVPEYMVPARWVRVEKMPLTPNGKIDRRALEEVEWSEEEEERQYVEAETELERELVEIWKNVLGVEEVGVEDNFFRMGGDSIKSIKVVAQSQERGIRVKVEELFQHQTIRSLASAIEEQDGEGAAAAAEKRTEAMSLVRSADREKMGEEIEDAYPLTRLQAGMIFHTEMSPESAVYHSIMSLHVEGELEVEKLSKAVEGMVGRHAILRTSFDLESYSEPMQLVHREVKIKVEEEDIRGMSEEEKEGEIRKWIEEESRRKYEWRVAPLMRIVVHRRTDQTFQFSFSAPHAIFDGWSDALFLTEIVKRYMWELEGRGEWKEEELKSSYRDYVAAEQEALKSEESREYWKRKIESGTSTRLPRLKRGADAGPGGHQTLGVELGEEVCDALDRLRRDLGVPMKTVLLAAHLRALAAATGQKDVMTGVVTNGRMEETDGEQVLGLFLNTLPFDFELKGGTWEDLIREVFEEERQMIPHRRHPMSEMQIWHDVNELFETGFNYTHYHVYDTLNEISNIRILGGTGVAETNFNLSAAFNLDVTSTRVNLILSSNGSELTPDQIESIAGYYKKTLTEMALNPKSRYDFECLLSDRELRLVLEQFNSTAAPFPDQACIHDLIREQAEASPEQTAVVFQDREISYRELERRSNQVANYLVSRGVRPEMKVGVCLERGIEMIVGVLGILKAGGAYVPLDPAYPPDRLSYMIEDAELRLLLAHEHLVDLLPPSEAEVVCIDRERAGIEEAGGEPPSVRVHPDNLVYVIYTSGSTGRPKGVQISHSALCNHASALKETYGSDPDSRYFQFFSLNFDASGEDIFPALAFGSVLVCHPHPMQFTGRELLEFCEQQSITILHLPVAYWHEVVAEMVSSDLRAPDCIRQVGVGGETPSSAKLATWAERSPRPVSFHNLYGPTETTITSAIYSLGNCAKESVGNDVIPIGRPLSNVHLYILDPFLHPTPVGAPGELYIGGVGVARGYLGRPELTALSFLPNPLSREPGDRIYRTGDFARYLPDGNIEFLGRIDQQVKIRGFRIEIGEIESTLARHPRLENAAVMAREDVSGDKQLVAYLCPRPGQSITPGEARDFLRERLPNFMLPTSYVVMEEFPMLLSGKVDRRALPAPEGSHRDSGTPYAAPRDEVEEELSRIWAEVLGLERVGIHDNFFEIGGHSLKATQVVSRIRKLNKIKISLRDLFLTPTIAALSELVRAGENIEYSALEKASEQEYYEPSHAQRGLWVLCQGRNAMAAYNLPRAYILEGALNVDILEEAFRTLVERHESLRSTFLLVDGELRQKVNRDVSFRIRQTDISGRDDREELAFQLAAQEAAEPFNFEECPLMRVRLVKLEEDRYLFLYTVHHIISDGWSMNVLVNEIFTLYGAYSRGEENPLKPLRVQYKDYVAWQKEQLSGEQLEEHRRYWLAKLSGDLPVLSLQTDRPRPQMQSFGGDQHAFRIGPELTEGLYEIIRAQGASLFMGLLAALYALLHRYTSQTDIIIGTPIAGRSHSDLEDQIGYYLNNLALRTEVRGEDSFCELLDRVKETTLGAYEHQIFPFDWLIRELNVKRDASRAPLVDVGLTLQNQNASEPGARNRDDSAAPERDIRIISFEQEHKVSRNDLWFYCNEFGEEIFTSINYNTALFTAESIELMGTRLVKLISQVVADPEIRIMDIELATEESGTPEAEAGDMELDFELNL